MVDKLIEEFLTDLASVVNDFIKGSSPIIGAKMSAKAGGKTTSAANFASKSVPKASKKPRKKGPIQLCPVPRCKNRAAPVFGMVCSKHKDLPKAKIKAFREARRSKADKKLHTNARYGKFGVKKKAK